MSVSLLGLLNLFSQKSSRSRLAARDVPYGPADRQRLDIYAPKQPAPGPLPVVVFIYGGSWSDGDRRDYRFVGRFLASLGYLAVLPDYRLIPTVEYPTFLEDVAAAIAWTNAQIGAHGGDPARLAVMGHSAGAYNAVMSALDPSLGVSDLIRAAVGLSGPYDFYPYDVDVTRRTFREAPDPEATQPVNLVTAAAPPMLLASGDADRTVFPRNTIALAARLRQANVEVEERHYPGVTHAGTLLELGSLLGGKLPLAAEIERFLARHIGQRGAVQATLERKQRL